MLLNRLKNANDDLTEFLHSHTSYKYYTFSNIVLEDRIKSKNGLQFRNGHFLISALDQDFIKGFATGLLQEPEFSLGVSKFKVTNIQILRRKEINSICTMRTLSPIYVKTKRITKEGKLKETDLYPTNGKFHENLHQNLVEKYKAYYGKKPKNDHFEIVEIHTHKEKRNKIKGDYRRCTEMIFDIQGSKELLQFGYEVGFGEKNAMGFGCVEVIN